MQDVELYADLISSIVQWARHLVGELSAEELAWQPDAEGNNIAVTIWHFSRWFDVTARVLQNRPREEELWLTRGWAERTGYNPQGIGYLGLGTVTGYTVQEVAAVPLLSAQDLLAYLEQVCAELCVFLDSSASLEALRQPLPDIRMPGQKFETKRQLLQNIIMGSCGHMGEAEALKAMMRRAKRAI